MRAAQIADGVVVNVIVVENEVDADLFGATLCPPFVSIGWSYDGTTWTEPPQEEEPKE